ncbi:MAG: hypothetical protein RLZZ227_1595 [Pseudomonadota bacterium]|jgi:TolA-binding protein
MSLLMEALRKAEEAKRRMQQEEQQTAMGKELRDASDESRAAPRFAASSFSLEEREAAGTPDYIFKNFSGNPDEIGNAPGSMQSVPGLAAAPESGPLASGREPSARNLARRQQRSAAASVFVAKQNPARNRKTLTVLVIVMVLMVLVDGGVLWYLQVAPQPSIGVNPSIASYDLSTRGFVGEAPVPPAAAVAVEQTPGGATAGASTATPGLDSAAVAPAEAVVPAEAESGAVPVATPAAAEDMVAVTAPPVQTLDPEEGLPPPTAAVAEPRPAPTTGAPLVAATETADSALALPQVTSPSVLQISRSGGARQINPGLSSAYASLQAGELEAAGLQYQQVLDTMPNSRDALLGLGLVRLRAGELAAARELYVRALQLNPRDPLAQTGLLQTMPVVNPSEHESTLLTLIDQYPDVAPLPLALGNLYAEQQRWSEAQGAYYNALLLANRNSSGPVHPDYAFNLAVSLEQLNQGKAALGYYRQAQTLAREVTPGFDPQLLTSRLDFLQRQDQP